MDKLKMHTPNLADENYKKLAALFPNAVTEVIVGYEPELNENGQEKVGFDGKIVMKPIVERAIDKDILMQEISARVVEGREERYQFTWPDKKKAMLAANAPISATLRPVREDSVGKDGTPGGWDSENLYIEGDNLDVLKLLQETYLGKVKMIYIDPPYNTGNDFVYEDDFAEDADSYLERSGQFDDQGNRLEQNTESNGRFHTDWLNMLYPRLKLVRNLLADDGCVFISIDDNEVANLRTICDEVFGRDSFIGCFIWKRRQIPDNRNQNHFSPDHEYIIVFGKQNAILHGKEFNTANYSNPDNDSRGPWFSADLSGLADQAHRPNLHYDIANPQTGIVYHPNPTRGWCCSKETFNQLIKEDRIIWPAKPDGRPRRKKFLSESVGTHTSISSVLDVGYTTEGTKTLQALFNQKVFDFPKPISLLRELIIQTTQKDDIILDMFSGSASLSQAVMEQNVVDQGKRKIVSIQIPEKTDNKFNNICEVGKERIRRAGRKIKEEAGLTAQDLDIGFRVLRLDSSNMQDVYYNPTAMTQSLLDATTSNIKTDRTPEDLLFQVMLDLGVDLSSPIQENTIDGKKVFAVAGTYLLACFDAGVTTETVTAIAKQHPYYAVFRDSSMANDSVATNFDQIFETYSPGTVRRVL